MAEVSTITEPKKSHREFRRYGDRELWLVRGNAWQLPVLVEWFVEVDGEGLHAGLVYPACVMYLSQALALTDLLGTHDILGKADRWLVPRLTVESILTKAPGLTPLYYYQWPEEDCPGVLAAKSILVPLQEEARNEHSSEAEAFMSHLSQSHSIPLSMIRVVWNAIQTEGARWLLDRRGAIDLGFTKLFAAPFRANWKQIIAWKCRRWGLGAIFRLPKAEMEAELERRGFDEVLCSTHNLGLSKARTDGDYRFIDYTIEAIPSKSFVDAALECERGRWSGAWDSYVASLEETIEAHYHNLVAAIKAYVKKVSLPFARIHEGGKSGGISLMPAAAFGESVEVRGAHLRRLPVNIVETGRRCSLLSTRGPADDVRPAITEVQELQNIPQGEDDMRGCEEPQPVEECERAGGDTGVPLLDAGQGDAAGEPVLPEPKVDTGGPPEASSGVPRLD